MTTQGEARDWTGPEGDDELVAAAELTGDDAAPSVADAAALAAVTVVSGAPDEDELAALLAGLATARALARGGEAGNGEHGEAAGGHRTSAGPGGDAWGDHARRLGVRTTGPDAWRWSAAR